MCVRTKKKIFKKKTEIKGKKEREREEQSKRKACVKREKSEFFVHYYMQRYVLVGGT